MRRSTAVLLCMILILSTAFSITAFADYAVVTTGSMYSYFQTFSSAGKWVDIATPSHWITDTGEVAYCLQTNKNSPYNSGYYTVDGTDYYDWYTLIGLYAILENGYPVSTGGFTDEEARYATANAIRFWCAENYCDGVPQYLNLYTNGDWIRGKYGFEELFDWCLWLVQLARDQDVSFPAAGSISFSESSLAPTEDANGEYFVGSASVSTSISGGYALTHDLPNGSGITGYTGQNGDRLTIQIPTNYGERDFTVTAYGFHSVETAKLFFWQPDVWNQQRIVTCVLDTDSSYLEASMTVSTPKATQRNGTIRLTKVDENGAPLPGVSFTLYDSGKNAIQNGQTDENGVVSFEVPTGDYFYCETATLPHLVLDSTLYPVSVTEGGQLVTETVVNDLARGNLKIVKRDAYEYTPLAGAGFRLLDSDGQPIAEGYTDTNGELRFDGLLCGSYSYQEFAAPKGYMLDDTVYPFLITEHGVTVTQERDNLRRPGTLEVKKQDHNGAPLAGVSFLLEYSVDNGMSWAKVFPCEGGNVQTGGCTSPGLADGQLTTGESGCVTFSGLRADGSILYRLTETKAPDGHSLVAGSLYVGTLPVEVDDPNTADNEHCGGKTYTYTLYSTVTDCPVFRLPETGGSGFRYLPIFMLLTAATILLPFKRRTTD